MTEIGQLEDRLKESLRALAQEIAREVLRRELGDRQEPDPVLTVATRIEQRVRGAGPQTIRELALGLGKRRDHIKAEIRKMLTAGRVRVLDDARPRRYGV